MEATGTRVDISTPVCASNLSAPDRNWLSMSASEPSWFFGNTSTATLPSGSLLMRSPALAIEVLSG
jgi:hypothetical protein